MKSTMYPDNPYIQGAEEIAGYNLPRKEAMDKYDGIHGLRRDATRRAQYRHWLSAITGIAEIMSREDREILGLAD